MFGSRFFDDAEILAEGNYIGIDPSDFILQCNGIIALVKSECPSDESSTCIVFENKVCRFSWPNRALCSTR